MDQVSKIWEDFNLEIKTYVTRCIGAEALVDDIVQDVFLKLMNYVSKINKVYDIQMYLYKIIRNTIADKFKIQKKTKIPRLYT